MCVGAFSARAEDAARRRELLLVKAFADFQDAKRVLDVRCAVEIVT
jgi:hypothetical protein